MDHLDGTVLILEMMHYVTKLMPVETKKFLQDHHSTAMLVPVVGFEPSLSFSVCLHAHHALTCKP